MNLQDMMVVWTPKREPFENYPTAGKLAVTTIPEPQWMKKHPSSFGACNLEWKDADHEGRIKLLEYCVSRMVFRDNMNEDDVRNALKVLEDVDPLSLQIVEPED